MKSRLFVQQWTIHFQVNETNINRTMKLAILFPFAFLLALRANSQDLLNGQDKINYKSLSQRWELNKEDKKGTFRLTSYKPFYVTAGRRSNNPNLQPYSENPDYSVPEPKPYNNYEARFQLSFKTKVWNRFCLAMAICGSPSHRLPIGRYTTRNYQGLLGN